jgi:hypothetical protein
MDLAQAFVAARKEKAAKAEEALTPSEWATKYIEGLDLTDYQCDILDAVPTHHRVTARGPRGLGKTALVAVAILWFAIEHERRGIDWKIVTTSGSHYQLRHFLWPEVHKWARKLDWEALGMEPWKTEDELLRTGLHLDYGNASSAAPGRVETIEGAHADAVMVVFDEAKIIPAETFDAIEGVFSGVDAEAGRIGYALAVSTPGAPAGRFYDLHRGKPGFENWWVRHVKLEEAVGAGRVSEDWAALMAKAWGTDSAAYANHVEGAFRADDEDSVIPLAWIEAAQERWRDHQARGASKPPGCNAGVDVARFGGDSSVVAMVHGDWVAELERLPRLDTIETVSEVLRVVPRGANVIVDADGIGVGVLDGLRHQGVPAEAFHGAPPSPWRDRSGELEAFNRRAAAWYNLRELLDPAHGATLMLPPDDELLGDLTGPRRQTDVKGRLKIEKKADTKKRLGRSPDAGDALVYALYLGVEGVVVEYVDDVEGEKWDEDLDWSSP